MDQFQLSPATSLEIKIKITSHCMKMKDYIILLILTTSLKHGGETAVSAGYMKTDLAIDLH